MTLTRKIGSLRYFYSASYFFSAILVIVSAIVPHALSKGIILRRIFTTASYCMVLRMTLTRQLPGSIQMWYDTLALVTKIEVGPETGLIYLHAYGGGLQCIRLVLCFYCGKKSSAESV